MSAAMRIPQCFTGVWIQIMNLTETATPKTAHEQRDVAYNNVYNVTLIAQLSDQKI